MKKVYDLLFSNFSRLLYKTKQIVLNEEVLHNSGNQFLRAREHCDTNEIVVTLNLNSSLIGRQFLKVVNAIYQDENTWMAMFPSLTANKLNPNILANTQNFRHSEENI